MVPIGELSEYAKSGLPTAAKGIVQFVIMLFRLLYVKFCQTLRA